VKTFVVIPDSVMNFMAYGDTLVPAKELVRLGCHAGTCSEFFQKDMLDSIKPEDNVLLYFMLHDETHVPLLQNLKCNKFLRNGDPCKSDGVLFRTDLELHEKINFDCIFVGTPSQINLEFLKAKDVNTFPFTQCLDFSDQRDAEEVFLQKTRDGIITGQLHREFYPVRQRVADYWVKNSNRFNAVHLPHPGYELDNLAHPYVGSKYIDFISQFWTGGVGTGHADGLHAKFLEFAKAYTLPIGNVPTYMHPRAQELILQVGIDESDEEMDRQITELFSDKEALKERILEYVSVVKQEYNLQKVVGAVYEAMTEKTYLG